MKVLKSLIKQLTDKGVRVTYAVAFYKIGRIYIQSQDPTVLSFGSDGGVIAPDVSNEPWGDTEPPRPKRTIHSTDFLTLVKG